MKTYFWQDKIYNFPLCDQLIFNFDIIKNEIMGYINKPDVLQNYPNYQVMNDKMIYENYWKATPCTKFKEEHVELNGSTELKNLLKYLVDQFKINCPITYSIINVEEENGNLTNSFISRLIPGTIINPHYGWSTKYMRIHLGIECDPDCKITVGDQTMAWEEGKILAFNDSDVHSVVHKGIKERVVFSFDINLFFAL